MYIDLFSGCGGLALGFHKSGWKGLFAIEKNKDAFLTLEHNLISQDSNFIWPDWLPKKNHDINIIIQEYKEYLKSLRGKISLIAGGPPCQGFSMAGRRKENDDRNKLIKSYIRFIELVQPKMIFFENVRGFMIGFKQGNNRGYSYSDYVVNELEKLGYNIKGKIIDFSEYGIPQKRQRYILVGIKEEFKINTETFFDLLVQNREKFLRLKNLKNSPSLSEAISDLQQVHGLIDSPDTKNFKSGIYGKSISSYQKLMRKDNALNNKIPDSHRFANHKEETIEKFKYILNNSVVNKNISYEIKAKYNLKKRTIVPLCGNSPTPTLTTLPDDYIHYCEPRILTVREYARIQSFPDNYEFKGSYTTGGNNRKIDVPRYTQVGNAIPPLFAEQVGLVLKGILL